MFKAIKRLFKFDYWSPFDIATCKERLTFEYWESLYDKRLSARQVESGWSAAIWVNEKGVIRIKSRLSSFSALARFCFTYRYILEETDGGTVLHCKHNPFRFSSLSSFMYIILLVWAGAGYFAVKALLDTGNIALFFGYLAIILLVTPLIMIPTIVLERGARREASSLLNLLVIAEPMKKPTRG